MNGKIGDNHYGCNIAIIVIADRFTDAIIVTTEIK
jgi:hypothetical protein